MFLHSTREGDYPNQIQHPENIPHPLQTAGPVDSNIDITIPGSARRIPGLYCTIVLFLLLQYYSANLLACCIVFAIAGLYAEQNILIFKVLASFLAGILKLMHHMVNLSNESGQA